MRKRGFTLFEVLVSLAVMVILVGTIASTLKIAFGVKRAAEEAVISVRDIQTAGDIFSDEVSDAIPPNPLSASPDSLMQQNASLDAQAADPLNAGTMSGGITGANLNGTSGGGLYLFGPFKGDSVTLAFYSSGSEPNTLNQAGVHYAEYSVAMQNDGHLALIRKADSNLLADNALTNLAEEALVTNVVAVQFQYYDGTGWADVWDSTSSNANNQLPFAVKMVLTLEPTHVGGPQRVITRVATIWCAQKTVNDYTAAENALTATNSTGQLP